jgi:HPt (histidine-containing phosphotransfer) domain-containing protein
VFNHLSSIAVPTAEAKGLDILFAVDPALPQNLKGDSMRLSQILNNIVSNAVKFTEHGEILINCALLTKEQVSPQQRDGQQSVNKARNNKLGLQFLVHDTGIGMSEEQVSELFTAFKQIDGTITRKYGGTGLGLALTKKLVEMMGGEIYISSAVNEGTDVLFTIFVEAAEKPHNTQEMPAWERTLTGSALPDAPGFNTAKALEHLGGNLRLYYILAQQFCARHSKDDARIDKAITYGDLQEAAVVAHCIKGLSATLGAENLALKAGRIEDVINQNKELNDEFYWLFDGFCAEFSIVLNLLQQSEQLCGLKIVVQDAHNIPKGGKPPDIESSEAARPTPESVQSVITPQAQTKVLAENLNEQVAVQADVRAINYKQSGLSGAVLDIIMALKLKMEDDDASAMTYIQSNLDALSKEIPPVQLRKLTEAVESFDYSAGLESLEDLLP